jgi:hypothetical protein
MTVATVAVGVVALVRVLLARDGRAMVATVDPGDRRAPGVGLVLVVGSARRLFHGFGCELVGGTSGLG